MNPSRINEAIEVVQGRVFDTMREILDAEFTREEIVQAIKNMKPSAPPETHEMRAMFFKKFWNIVGDEVINLVPH